MPGGAGADAHGRENRPAEYRPRTSARSLRCHTDRCLREPFNLPATIARWRPCRADGRQVPEKPLFGAPVRRRRDFRRGTAEGGDGRSTDGPHVGSECTKGGLSAGRCLLCYPPMFPGGGNRFEASIADADDCGRRASEYGAWPDNDEDSRYRPVRGCGKVS